MQDRPFAFVCSPFRGDMEANAENAREYSRCVYEAGYTPLAPHLLFPQFLSEHDPAEREAGIQMGMALLAKCRLLVVCGDDITEGMAREIKLAGELKIPVAPLESIPMRKTSLLTAVRSSPQVKPACEQTTKPRAPER